MPNVVVQMGIWIDGYVSGGPGQDRGGGEPEHADVVARKVAWVSHAGVPCDGPIVTRPVPLGSGEPLSQDFPVERCLRLAEVTLDPEGTVISIYRRSR